MSQVKMLDKSWRMVHVAMYIWLDSRKQMALILLDIKPVAVVLQIESTNLLRTKLWSAAMVHIDLIISAPSVL